VAGRPGQKAKRPVYIRLEGGGLFAFAGLYAQDPDGTPTCAIITTTANELMAPIHARMPVILDRDDDALWLDPTVRDSLVLVPALRPYPAEAMAAYPVGTLVNNVRNEGPILVEPLPEPVP
jgi:putative SOS response-associated peptidase YedK